MPLIILAIIFDPKELKAQAMQFVVCLVQKAKRNNGLACVAGLGEMVQIAGWLGEQALHKPLG